MSGWTMVAVRGCKANNYKLTRKDISSREYATHDIAASFEEDSRVGSIVVHKWSTVYALLNCGRYGYEFAEQLMEDYGVAIDDAAVLGWNDTTDTGCVRYYDRPELGRYVMEYEETDPHHGEKAMAVVRGQYGIPAKNVFNESEREKYTSNALSGGQVIDYDED